MDEGYDDVERSRARWINASKGASELASALFQPGSGYGDRDAQLQDEHRLNSARTEAERAYREYADLALSYVNKQMVELQASQRKAAWLSLLVAAVVGLATVLSLVLTLIK